MLKPQERYDGLDRTKASRGQSIYETVFYSDAADGRTYCGGTFINDFSRGHSWEYDAQARLFVRQEGIYYTRHLDKLQTTADHLLLRDSLESFIAEIVASGIKFR